MVINMISKLAKYISYYLSQNGGIPKISRFMLMD